MYIGPNTSNYGIYCTASISETFYLNIGASGNQVISGTADFGVYINNTKLSSFNVSRSSSGGFAPSSSNYVISMNGSLSTKYLGSFAYNLTRGHIIEIKFESISNLRSDMPGSSISPSGPSASVSVNWTDASYVNILSSSRSGTVFISPSESATNIYGGTTYINVAPSVASGGNPIGRHISIGAAGKELVYIKQPSTGWTTTSDKRDKADFKDVEKSLSFINKLKPLTFVDNSRINYYDDNNKFDEDLYNSQCYKGHRRIAGFIAQDVYQTLNDVYQDNNYASIVDYSKYDDPDNEIDRYYMLYTQLIPFLTGAIQELSKEIDSLKETIQLQQETINSLTESNSTTLKEKI